MKKRKAAIMQITRECNNECIFCSNPQFKKDFTLGEAKKLALKLKEDGVTEVFLSGGEPTIAKLLLDIISYLKEIGINPRIITNGVKLEDIGLAKKIYNAGVRDINVSIHSHKASIADKLSQREGYFEKTLKGIRNLIDCGFNVNLNTTINSLNCKHLLDYAKFFTQTFPEIRHFVFNGLDPGCSDGTLKSRAGENPWIVPRLVDFELELKEMVDFLKSSNKTFRIERVPLCYMGGFEEVGTETRKIVKDEFYIASFIEKAGENELRVVDPKYFYMQAECCNCCKLNKICAGIQKEYIDLHTEKEVYPVFDDPASIIKKIREKD